MVAALEGVNQHAVVLDGVCGVERRWIHGIVRRCQGEHLALRHQVFVH
ncbi:MAG TPA: hypothetical protein PK468_20390 [Candidatus Hydrogenedentes bacterium]|nr:hypothetical protein [Candidatus Hydrogenedentota bacterium]